MAWEKNGGKKNLLKFPFYRALKLLMKSVTFEGTDFLTVFHMLHTVVITYIFSSDSYHIL